MTTRSLEVVDGGTQTTVQDLPGRVGYWHVGVPPNGPMDDLSHSLVNRVVGNAPDAAGLEIVNRGPDLRAHEPLLVAIGGAATEVSLVRAGGSRCTPDPWTPIHLDAGDELRVGAIRGPGMRAYLAVRGGIDVEPFLGSRSTFTLGAFGGLDGRPLRSGDVLAVGQATDDVPRPLPPGMPPHLRHDWELGVLVGPHTAPEFLTPEGLRELLGATWEVHHNSARTGVRLIGPRPDWARPDGGEAGLHPSNIHDTGYAIGAVDLTGDMPVILGPDGPSLGGFVCPAVVAASQRWKLGQLAPGDRVRLVPWSQPSAASATSATRTWLTRATHRAEPLARPNWNARLVRTGTPADAVLHRSPPDGDSPGVTYRQAGDRFLLVEFGDMLLDLALRVRVHALQTRLESSDLTGVVDVTPGVRSLLVQVDGDRLDVPRCLDAVRALVDGIDDLDAHRFRSRVVHLPLSWDDPATREAIERYMHGVRPDAPWCPWNIEFIRRINGLASVDDVRRIVFDASYLVLGLGDVYLGAPVATPLDPRHRLVTTKYNPARTWTPENAVGIGGSYLCIYGMEGPGGYQFVGRTVQVWNSRQAGEHFELPWLLRPFDQLRWYPVDADELLDLRADQAAGRFEVRMDDTTFSLADHQQFVDANRDDIEQFRRTQQHAFAAERSAWSDGGEFRDAS